MFFFVFASFYWFVNISDESATIRVTNLSEDTRESDLQELFRPFGPIQRIYLAKDKNTGQSKVRLNTAHVVSLKHYHKTMVHLTRKLHNFCKVQELVQSN